MDCLHYTSAVADKEVVKVDGGVAVLRQKLQRGALVKLEAFWVKVEDPVLW